MRKFPFFQKISPEHFQEIIFSHQNDTRTVNAVEIRDLHRVMYLLILTLKSNNKYLFRAKSYVVTYHEALHVLTPSK